MAIASLSGWQRAIWLVIVCGFAILENRAIDRDRAEFAREQQEERAKESAARKKEAQAFEAIAMGINTAISNGEEQFRTTMDKTNRGFASTMRGLKETVSVSTGGDDFCYLVINPETKPGPIAAVIHPGKFPLFDINIWIVDEDKNNKYLKQASADPDVSSPSHMENFIAAMQDSNDQQYIQQLIPRWSNQLPTKAAYLDGDHRNLQIFFNARNGGWKEHYGMRLVKGKWLQSIQVYSGVGNKKLFERIDLGYG